MHKSIRSSIDDLRSEDRELQNKAFFHILKLTEKPVEWTYEVWDKMLEGLSHKDNHVRAISAQSDPNGRMLKDFDKLLAVTKDERFVTARHCMQSLWKIGVVGIKQQTLLVDSLAGRFEECIIEKNGTLIRYDILQSLRNVYDAVKD